jgi:hypothetical protein
MHEKVNGVKSLFHDLVTYHALHACTMRTNFDINNSYKCLRLTDDRNQCSIFSGNWWLLRYVRTARDWTATAQVVNATAGRVMVIRLALNRELYYTNIPDPAGDSWCLFEAVLVNQQASMKSGT